MSLSVHRRLRDAVGDKEGPIGAHGAAPHRHRAPAAASATTSYASSPEGAGSALASPSSWQPLPRALPKRRRVGTSTNASASADSGRKTARMTWPPERTPMRGLAGGSGALSSPRPRGLTLEEDYLGWLGSLRSRTQPRSLAPRRDAVTSASASAPPSPTASSAARIPPSRRSGIINASASSPTVSSAALTGTPQDRLQASAASFLGSTLPPLSVLATASHGGRRHPPPTKQPTGTRVARSPRPKTNSPIGTPSAVPPLQTTKRGPDASSPQTNPAPPPPFLAAFGQRIFEALFNLNYRFGPPPQLTKPTTGSHGGSSQLQTNMVALALDAPPLPPHLTAFSQKIIEMLFNLNYGHLGYTGVVLLGVYAGLKELLSGWNTILKVFYVLLLIMGAFSLGTGLMAATSISPTGYTHQVSSVCSRMCTCLATFVFIVALACHMGSHGYIAGIVLGVVAVCFMLSVWIEGDPAAYGAYTRAWNAIKDLRQRFKWSVQRGRILP